MHYVSAGRVVAPPCRILESHSSRSLMFKRRISNLQCDEMFQAGLPKSGFFQGMITIKHLFKEIILPSESDGTLQRVHPQSCAGTVIRYSKFHMNLTKVSETSNINIERTANFLH